MKRFLSKLNNKDYVQKILVELIGDAFMIALGVIMAYYIKTYLIGF